MWPAIGNDVGEGADAGSRRASPLPTVTAAAGRRPSMKPKLIAIAGPSKGTIIELDESPLSLGRDASNRVALADLSVSRRHCEIAREGQGFKLTDLDSHNGTFVNDVPTKEHLLAHGDRLRVGNSYFLFLV